MPRIKSFFLIFFTNCMLLDLTYGIIGSQVRHAKVHEFPFAVSIAARPTIATTNPRLIANLHFCTGTLVSHKNVLTAAHCLLDKHPDRVEIIAGSANVKYGEKYYPDSWITFDQWNLNRPTPYPMNDIAVIYLDGQGITKPGISPAPILTVDHEYLNGRKVRIMGWGQVESGKSLTSMRTAYLTVISNLDCSVQGTMVKGSNFTVPPNYFCTKNNPYVLSSPGDGGAPIVDNTHHLVGINIGVCPKIDGYPKEMLHELQMNSHLNFHFYKDFLKNTIVK